MTNTARLVTVCGLPGAGKTTVAEAAAERLDADLLRTDVVRKELFSDPEYTSTESRRTYEELLARADDALAAGHAVVLDGTFRRASRRNRAREVADRNGVPFDLLRVACEERVAKERLREREGDASDADVRVYDLLREEFEPVDDPVVVDNSGDLDATMSRVQELF
ncbi:AAA family ATPase [Halobaculum sp. CBA1158]|uniref:AAA family ATPase n=1 Tax=Halobaculum sp. CBA1158 TaxID=2904243 RepID=UPI001F2C0969|nr:AAA family ATPase [Halobaculum sp. CBA1158]UIO99573.1 AAA family ATPase [Halobaculum sp. CBA1158]